MPGCGVNEICKKSRNVLLIGLSDDDEANRFVVFFFCFLFFFFLSFSVIVWDADVF